MLSKSPLDSPTYRGALKVDADLRHFRSSWSDVETENAEVKNGSWRPKNCAPEQKIVIVIPIRDRCIVGQNRVVLRNPIIYFTTSAGVRDRWFLVVNR